MIIKREKIKDFDIPKDYMEKMLDILEESLKDVETDLEDEVIYTVINNLIEFKIEEDKGYNLMGEEFLSELTKRVLKKDNKIDFWYNYEDLYEEVTGRKLRRNH